MVRCDKDADDCFLVAFMLDARYNGLSVINGSSDKTKFKEIYEREDQW